MPGGARWWWCAIVAVLALLEFGGAGHAASGGAGRAAGAVAARASTVWLCRPGVSPDPCAGSLTATVVQADGSRTFEHRRSARKSRFDCFYVYPTVSQEPSENADLTIQPAEIAVAQLQAERFSQVCRVWAPMYRQRTEGSLLQGLDADPQADVVAYQSVVSAWREYLAEDNDGRPVVFIGHSQGAAILIRLLSAQIDPHPPMVERTALAIILGGNVTVPKGRTVGASFNHIPICTRVAQARCVIAYSSFPSQPPATAFFGRPGQGVSLQSDQTDTQGVQVACVNPAAIAGGTAILSPYALGSRIPALSPPATTPWVTFPDLYRATCRSDDGASWLDVQATAISGDHRPVVTEQLGPDWGYHLDDVNLALGDLVSDVAAAERTYSRTAGR